MKKKCLWCLETEPQVTFERTAHTIPKSLGGQNYNPNVCDNCNNHFGDRKCNNGKYSIEEALKEAFIISRTRLLNGEKTKRKIGRFKSKFFDVKEKKGKLSLSIKTSFRFSPGFQKELCNSFKRGLYKMYFEELNRQKNTGFETKFDIIRNYGINNIGELPVFYFTRKFGIMMMLSREAETPILLFDRMKYLYSNDKFSEIEFLGHVFGFPISDFDRNDLKTYISESLKIKKDFFTNAIILDKLTDIDLALNILNDKTA
jgi:HNH endonuclease